jgi:hypothetical protein
MKTWIVELMYYSHKILTKTSGDMEGKQEFISEIHKRKSFRWTLHNSSINQFYVTRPVIWCMHLGLLDILLHALSLN